MGVQTLDTIRRIKLAPDRRAVGLAIGASDPRTELRMTSCAACRRALRAAAVSCALAPPAQQQARPSSAAAKPGLRPARRPSFQRSIAAQPIPRRAEQIRRVRGLPPASQQAEIDRQQAHGAAHGLRQATASSRCSAASRRNAARQQQDPADAGQSRPHPRRSRAPAGRRRAGARRPAPRDPGGAGAEQLRPAVSARQWQRRSRAAACSSRCSAPAVDLQRQAPRRDGPRPGGTYRTVCVRTCDGYYFPISYSPRRRAASPRTKRSASACARRRRPCCSPIAIRART